MAREVNRLTDPQIRSLKPGDKDVFVNDGNGLYLRVRATGSKSWIIRRKVGGKQVVVTLGQYPTVSLRDARDEALRQAARHSGVSSATMRVSDAMEEYLAQLRWKRMANARTYGAAIVAAMGSKRVRDLSSRDVLTMVERYRVGRPVAGNRLLAFSRQFFGWCEDHSLCPVSPAARLQRRRHGSQEEARTRVLSEREIKVLMKLEGRHAPLLKFLLFVPCRISEAQGMEWEEIQGSRWNIPASRTKSGKSHFFEIPPAAMKLLGKRGTGRVFRAVSPTAVQAYLRRWQRFDDNAWTPHDLRRTARTHATGTLGVRESVAERWLGHELQGLLAVYDTSEFEKERVKLSRDWAAHIKKLAG